MPTIPTTVTPVQIKLGVTDKTQLHRSSTRRRSVSSNGSSGTPRTTTSPATSSATTASRASSSCSSSISPIFDRPHGSTIGFLVPDLDTTHRNALAAGAAEAVAPADQEGMPRTSAVTDPDGNWIWLYQG